MAAAVVAVALAGAPGGVAAQDRDPVRVVHITLDSLMPGEVGTLTPTLAGLRADGTWYEQARSVMAAETLPNHVAMATGTYPERNGIPGNEGRGSPGDTSIHVSPVEGESDLGDPALLEAPSLVSVIEATCPDLRTVTVFSKQYVDNVFQADPADVRFPQEDFNVPGSGHAIDLTTVPAILDELRSGNDVDYLFANLGDIDRLGHIDTTGFLDAPLGRQAGITQTDTLLGQIVATLQSEGLWDSTVLVLSSDHGMDFSNAADPSTYVDVLGALNADARTADRFFTGINGGAGLVYLLDPDAPDADEVLAAAREVVTALPGVDEALYRLPNPLDPGHDLAAVHPDWHLAGTHRAGELFVTVEAGHKVSAPLTALTASGLNPLPGNHGHPLTRHIVTLVTGGWDGLAAPQAIGPSDPDAVDTTRYDDTAALPEQVEQVDFAPTFGWLLGVPDPGWNDGGPQWQGRVLSEAFTRQPAPRCAALADPAPTPSQSPTAPSPSPSASPPPTSDTEDDAGAPLPATGSGAVRVALLVLAGALLLAGARRPRAYPR